MPIFEHLLHRHEQERHSRILARPSVWNRVRRDEVGFLSPATAAEAMGVTEEEVVELAHRGLLEWRLINGEICIQPAVVSIMAVREEAI